VLEYLGRNDEQVKIRGYRIELGEIESALARYESVREAAVVAREDVPGERHLVAYVTQRVDSPLNLEALRMHLKQALPQYMVPSALVILEVLPVTPSGKLDRRALAAPVQEAYVREHYEAPQGETEVALAKIWQELLRLERVGRFDNFFELGGHSLIATRVVAWIRELFDVELSVRALFEAPRLHALALCIVSEKAIAADRRTHRDDQLTYQLRQAIEGMSEQEIWAKVAEVESERGGDHAQ
jgi:hypothetical protein